MTAQRLDDAPWLRDERLVRLLQALERDGDEARVVGGAVRNALLGEPVSEIDIATTAVPDAVIRRATDAGFKPVPTGIEHGTVTIVAAGQPFEVTTLRQDVETYGRHARVAFGRDWKADAERRDFTVNALSWTLDGTVHDYVGGLDDLAAHHIRFIGDPKQRIAEDYLRILRFFRFHAAYGRGALDPAGLHACIERRGGLAQLSRERIRAELFKLLIAPHVLPVIATMSEIGLLSMLLAGVGDLAGLSNLSKMEAAIGERADPVRRLGALAVRIREDGERLFERLRLSGVEHDRLVSMGEGWWRVSSHERDGRALLYRLGRERFVDRVLLAWARSDAGAGDARWHALATLPQRFSVPSLPLRAADFLSRGVGKGPALGRALRAAEEAWIAADFPGDAETIARIADAAALDATRG